MKGIIFDWGGVIMRTEDYTPRHSWDERLNAAHGTVEHIVHGIAEWQQLQHGTITHAEYEAAVAQHLGITGSETTQLLTDFYKGDQLNVEAVTLIKSFAQREDVRVSLMSNNILALRDEIEDLELTPHFDAIVISAEIGVMKPHADAYRPAYERIGLLPEECIFIDDSPLNIQGAQAVGLNTIHFTPETNLAQAIEKWLNS